MFLSRLIFIACVLALIALVILKYTITLPFDDYVMTTIFLILALIAGYQLSNIVDKRAGKDTSFEKI